MKTVLSEKKHTSSTFRKKTLKSVTSNGAYTCTWSKIVLSPITRWTDLGPFLILYNNRIEQCGVDGRLGESGL